MQRQSWWTRDGFLGLLTRFPVEKLHVQCPSKGIPHPMSSCTSLSGYLWFHTLKSNLYTCDGMTTYSPFVQQKPLAQPLLRVPAASEAGKDLESHRNPGWKNLLLQSRVHKEIR